MNADRRQTAKLVIALVQEGHENGEISDETHRVLGDTLSHLQRQEHYQLGTQEKYEGKNASTDKQIAISRVALPALTRALAAYNDDDFHGIVEHLKVAVETDGSAPKVRRKRKARA